MSVKGIIHYDRLVNKRRRQKAYEDVEISFIWLDPDIDSEWPGIWRGRVELEGKTLDVWTRQRRNDTPESIPENRVWHVSMRFNSRSCLEVNVTNKDISDFLVKQDILPTRLAMEATKCHLGALAFAWVSAEMQDSTKENVLEWIQWLEDERKK